MDDSNLPDELSSSGRFHHVQAGVVGTSVYLMELCVSSCRCCALVSVVLPVAILSVVFCVICSVLMFVSDASGDHMMETYSSMGLVMALYVAMVVSFCFPHVVDIVIYCVERGRGIEHQQNC